jgi:succinoglycan biosynthesis transport protein ExoP
VERDTYYEVPTSKHEFSVLDLLRALRKRLWVVLLTTVLLVGAAVVFSLLQETTYEASIKVLIAQEEDQAQPGALGSDVQGLQQVTQTLAVAIDSRPVAEEAIRRLNLRISPKNLIEDRLNVEQIGTTQFINVTYEDSDPRQAQRIVDTIGEVFSQRVANTDVGNGSVTATVWERSDLPTDPVSPNLALNLGAGLVLGLLLGTALALLLEFFDDSWRSPEELEHISGITNFGTIPEFEVLKDRALAQRMQELQAEVEDVLVPKESPSHKKSDKDESGLLYGALVTLLAPDSVASEVFRSLRANLVYAVVDRPPKVIMITSPGPREGKSTVCSNLGVALAQAGMRTLIVDCDLRKPALHKIFGLRNFLGLVNVMVRERILKEVWHDVAPNLKVVSSGPRPLNPAELLGSERLSELLDEIRDSFDYILLDAPPIGAVSDPAVLAPRVDGVFLTVDAQNTRKRSVQRSMRSLEAVGANVLGTVMNKVKLSKADERYYAYE